MMQYSEELLLSQNANGGWSYHRGGGSWTEPTCYALLALSALGVGQETQVRRAIAWLRRCQRADGGLSPRESVQESTWLTVLTLLLPASFDGLDRHKAEAWTIAQTGMESGWVNRLRLWMLGADSSGDYLSYDGWAWYPGTAAWVGPTALSILALQKLARRGGGDNARLDQRIQQGRSFLLARRCQDGGWNHGSTRALGYDSDSYPETTGLALLALHGMNGPEIARGLVSAEKHLAATQSSEALSWLRLGLQAHGRVPSPPSAGNQSKEAPEEDRRSNLAGPTPSQHGGVMELALAALADAAREGRNPFLEA